MFKRSLTILCLLTAFCIGAKAQSNCSCNQGNGGCSASQTCPAGKIAQCSCSATGCSSSCEDAILCENNWQTRGIHSNVLETFLCKIENGIRLALGRI